VLIEVYQGEGGAQAIVVLLQASVADLRKRTAILSINGMVRRLSPAANSSCAQSLRVRILPESPEGGVMGKINVGRLILGGIVAGIVGDLLDYPVDGIWLAKMWNRQLGSWGLGPFSGSQFGWFMAFGIIIGLVSIWIYAAVRPRLGPGVKTAIYVGVAVWIIAFLLPNFALMWVTHFFNGHLTAYTTLGALVETVVGTIAGAALYKED
jgi:hypothetical protein